jgi:hypothetical protein
MQSNMDDAIPTRTSVAVFIQSMCASIESASWQYITFGRLKLQFISFGK